MRSVALWVSVLAIATGRAEVLFQLHAPDARVVYLAGDFNDWAHNEHGRVTDKRFAMRRTSTGWWRAHYVLPPGTHRFKFVVNGDRWLSPPGLADRDEDGNGLFRIRYDGRVVVRLERGYRGAAVVSGSGPIREPPEFYWGLGERFDAWNLAGQLIDVWARDMAQGGPRSSYFAVPFLISSRGTGWFVTDPGKVVFDLRAGVRISSTNIVTFRGTPAEIARAYTARVGRPAVPPAWVFCPWYSRNSYLSAYDVERVLEQSARFGLRPGVVVLEAWARSLQDFQWETNRYPNPAGWVEWLRARGVEVVLWETPSIWTSAPTYDVARSNGWLVLHADGSEYITDWLENGRKIDFRQPAARAWWTELHRPLVAMGVAGFKTDGGERHPDPEFHNQMPFYYQQAVLAAFPSNGVTFARSANAACAAHPLFWAGDQHAEWRSLRRVVRAGLSAALCGFPFWGHDIGGYTGTPTTELFIRWMQLGTFSPIMQFHGITPREPWWFGEAALQAARWCFAIRERLQSYLLGTARQASVDGIPMWRPMIWNWPDEPVARWCDDQFMLGDDLLVAPVLDPFPDREIWIPPGTWQDAWSGETVTGPTNRWVTVPLDRVPVFVRAGSPLTNLFPEVHAHLANMPPVRLPSVPPAAVSLDWGLPVRDDGFVHLSDSASAQTQFDWPGGALRLWIGSGDGLRVWLNDRLIYEKLVHRSPERFEDWVDAELPGGRHQLRVEWVGLPAGIGPRVFHLHITAQGDP